MNLPTLLVFIPACFALNMAPGPNNLLSISNASRYGFISACRGGIALKFPPANFHWGMRAILHRVSA